MGVDFKPVIPDSTLTPEKEKYTGQDKLKFWCQKVLPLVYDDSLSYYETICKVVDKLNELAAKFNEIEGLIVELNNRLKEEVTTILTEWYDDGTLEEIIGTALDNISGRVTQLETTLESTTENLELLIGSAQEDIGALETRVDEVEAEAAGALDASRKHTLNGKKCFLIGNSFAAGTGGQQGRGWTYYFQQLTGCDATIANQNGGDFISPGNSNSQYPGLTYLQCLERIFGSMAESARKEYEYVIVGGSYNDRIYEGVADAVIAFVNRSRELLPNAKVWIIPLYPGRRITVVNVYNVGVNWCNGAIAAGAATCSNTFNWFYGRPDLWHTDDVHLNEAGYRECAKYMAALIDGWDGETQTQDDANATLEEGITTSGFRCFRKGDRVSIGGALKLPDQTITGRLNMATLDATVRPGTIKFFPVYIYKAGSSETNGLATAAINAGTGILSLEPTNAVIPNGATVYFSIDYSIVI